METLQYLQKLMLRSRRFYALAVALALVVLALTIFAGWLLARSLVRQQITHRDAELLYATTLMEQLDARETNGDRLIENEAQIGFDAAILASRLKGVLGIRFFDVQGQFTDSFPATIQPQPLSQEALRSVRAFTPHSHYDAATLLSDVFIYLPEFATGKVERIPTLQVTVPLHLRDADELAGTAQFVVEGGSIAEEYRRLDRRLGGLATLAFAGASILLVVMLWPAFRQVGRLNRLLAQRNERLLRANEELAMAARSSALGAVSAHLMHGLKNPLASLAQFVNSQTANGSAPDDDDWQDALAASRRMQALVEQTLEVLADTKGEPAYDVAVYELAANVRQRAEPFAHRHKVDLSVKSQAKATISSRVANLVGLVLVNLTENAIQATPSGRPVTLTINHEGSRLVCRVTDSGPGFPAHLRDRLFLPCKSTREGGSGIGLTICKQLADHLGATLNLTERSGNGCVFTLELELARAAAKSEEVPE